VKFAAAAQILAIHLPAKPDKQVALPTPPKMPENLLRNAGVKDIGPIPARLAIKKIDIEEEKREMEDMQKKLKEAEIKMKKKMEELKAKKIEEEKQRKIQAEKDAKAARAKLAEEQFGAFQIAAPAISNVAQPPQVEVESDDDTPPSNANLAANPKVSALRRTFLRTVSKKRMSASASSKDIAVAAKEESAPKREKSNLVREFKISSFSARSPPARPEAEKSPPAASTSAAAPLDREIPTDSSQWEAPKAKAPLKFLATTARASFAGLNNIRTKHADRSSINTTKARSKAVLEAVKGKVALKKRIFAEHKVDSRKTPSRTSLPDTSRKSISEAPMRPNKFEVASKDVVTNVSAVTPKKTIVEPPVTPKKALADATVTPKNTIPDAAVTLKKSTADAAALPKKAEGMSKNSVTGAAVVQKTIVSQAAMEIRPKPVRENMEIDSKAKAVVQKTVLETKDTSSKISKSTLAASDVDVSKKLGKSLTGINPAGEISKQVDVSKPAKVVQKSEAVNRAVTDIIPARFETPAAIASSSTEAIKNGYDGGEFGRNRTESET